ncbi:hypothetical protein BOX15_Mlig029347g3 [Macrostomum lignano]|uniref:Uncharacterized protein n=1 Tax=Macrostomum lignano TaxID=282301 RepID=A0A267H0X6_9PLAT|nr:hypothetical protein BOX15_Mlig029347g1 [Macrostomum lignano]PAA91344.1 hypothetical protein BOX15_Mlig029347g3 [Macrostomum lignano]
MAAIVKSAQLLVTACCLLLMLLTARATGCMSLGSMIGDYIGDTIVTKGVSYATSVDKRG